MWQPFVGTDILGIRGDLENELIVKTIRIDLSNS